MSADWKKILRLWKWITVAFVMLLSTVVAGVLLTRLWSFELESRDLLRDLVSRQIRNDYEAVAEETYLKLDTLAIRGASIDQSLSGRAHVRLRVLHDVQSLPASARGGLQRDLWRPAGASEDEIRLPLWFGDLYLGQLEVRCHWNVETLTATTPGLVGLVASIGAGAALFWLLAFLVLQRYVFAPLVVKARSMSKAESMVHTAQMLAHDIKRPFSLLGSALDVMRHRSGGAYDAEAVDRIVRSATHSVDAMLADIMDLGRDQVLDQDHVSFRALTRAAVEMAFPRGAPQNLAVSLDLRHRQKLWADEQRLFRVLLNLMENAAQAVGDRRATLVIESRDTLVGRDGRRFVSIVVRNSGSFIPAEVLEHVFEPFFTAGKRRGRGLGLAIVKRIVTAHGGAIACRSDLTSGTAFEFRIPASDRPDDVEVAAPSAPQLRAVPRLVQTASPRLLIIEDDPFFAEALSERLRGLNVSSFTGPADLKAWLANRPQADSMAPVCIVMDMCYGAGEPDGEELARELRVLWPDCALILASDLADVRRSEYEGLGFWQAVLGKNVESVAGAAAKLTVKALRRRS